MNRISVVIFLIFFALSVLRIDGQATDKSSPASSELPITNLSDSKDIPTNTLLISPEKKNPVRIPKFTGQPVINGKLDDPVWKQAAIFKDFIQTAPGDNIAPSKSTLVYLGYDEKNLYIAFHCFDEPDKIRATIAKRDEIFNEDNVRVWLGTYNDRRRAYILVFNPYGIQQDGIYTEEQGPDFSIDIVMESKGMITADGWTVEVKIPFKSLRYTVGKGKLWSFNAARSISRFNGEFDQWMPQNRNISGFLIQHGEITGLDDIKTERTLEIVPNLTLSETGTRLRTIPQSIRDQLDLLDPGRFLNEPVKQDLGVNIKFGITPNITFDAAINPDFAEIESDAPVITANERFPISFQEKRPFFLEGADIFQSPLQVFYSRTIIDPDVAFKLTGKIGKTSFGLIAASDNALGNYSKEELRDPIISQYISEFSGKNATFGVIRLKHDIGKNNYIGFFGTYRNFPEQKNILSAFDGKVQFNPKTVLQFQFVGTKSKRCFFDSSFEPSLDQEQAQRNLDICSSYLNPGTYYQYRNGNGFGYFVNLSYTEKNRGFTIEASGINKDYRADVGFVTRTNTNNLYFGATLRTEPQPKAKIIRFIWQSFVRVSYDWQGRLQNAAAATNLEFILQRYTTIHFEGGYKYERLIEEEFGLKRSPLRNGAFFGSNRRTTDQPFFGASINTRPNKLISLKLFTGYTQSAFDLDQGLGARFPRVSPAALSGYDLIDPGTGGQFDFQLRLEIKPSDPLRFSVDYYKRTLKRDDTRRTALDSNILTLRSTYQFTRFTFVRARVDYNSTLSNFGSQFLAGWNPNPGTAIYIGYNDNFNYNGYSPYSGQFEPRFERNSRGFFIRMSYLLRKSF